MAVAAFTRTAVVAVQKENIVLSPEQKVFLVNLLKQFEQGCPHFGDESDAERKMLDEIIVVLGA
jgi:hypothetical protein